MNYKNYKYEIKGFSMTNDQVKILIDLLEIYKPKRICEFGSGQTTIIFEQYSNKYNCELISIEHDIKYKRKNTKIFNLLENESIRLKNLYINNVNKYEGFELWLENEDKFDLILIDSPYGYGFRENYNYSRIQLLSFLVLNKLSDNAIILYHDSERTNAKYTLDKFKSLLNEYRYNYNETIINDIPELTIIKIYKQ